MVKVPGLDNGEMTHVSGSLLSSQRVVLVVGLWAVAVCTCGTSLPLEPVVGEIVKQGRANRRSPTRLVTMTPSFDVPLLQRGVHACSVIGHANGSCPVRVLAFEVNTFSTSLLAATHELYRASQQTAFT